MRAVERRELPADIHRTIEWLECDAPNHVVGTQAHKKVGGVEAATCIQPRNAVHGNAVEMSERAAHHQLAIQLQAQCENGIVSTGNGAEGGVQHTIGGEARHIGVTLTAHIEVAADKYPAGGNQRSNRGGVFPLGDVGLTALIHDNGDSIGDKAIAGTEWNYQRVGSADIACIVNLNSGSSSHICVTIKDPHIIRSGEHIIVHGQRAGCIIAEINDLIILITITDSIADDACDDRWRQCNGIDRAIEGGARIERGVQGAVGLQPGEVIARQAVDDVKVTADQNPAIGLHRSGPNGSIRRGVERRVERPIGIHAGDMVARRAIEGDEAAADDVLIARA